jgi:hypothetical protein
MFRLIRWLLSLVLLAGAIYFAVAVPLGEKTLWQHLRAIAGSRESQELVDDVKRKAGLKQAPSPVPKPEAKPVEAKHAENAASSDKLSDQERKLLRKLIKERLSPPAE